MLAHRIIPTLLYRGEQLVKGQLFNPWRSVGHIQQAARIYATRGVDELCILDIGATPDGRGPNLELVAKIAEGNFTPLTVGGGVRSVEDVDALLRAGADKVAICSYPQVIKDASARFGSQAIVVAIDAQFNHARTHGGKGWIIGGSPVDYAVAVEKDGAGEILLTSIDREGMMFGYDLDLIRDVSEAVNIPVIAHGGAGSYEHMRQAIEAGADAVAAGAFFQFTDATPKGAAQYLLDHGVEARV